MVSNQSVGSNRSGNNSQKTFTGSKIQEPEPIRATRTGVKVWW